MPHNFLVVAGGSGSRMGNPVPKQFIPLAGLPVLMHTMKAMAVFDPCSPFFLVLPSKYFSYWEELCKQYRFHVPHILVPGGVNRFESVKNGLDAVDGANGLTFIHDGVRPIISTEMMQRLTTDAGQYGNAIPVVPLTESLRQLTSEGNRAAGREEYFIVQTPQVFSTSLIQEAYSMDYNETFTDDATVFEQYGHKIRLVPGDSRNLKITTSLDLQLAETILAFFGN